MNKTILGIFVALGIMIAIVWILAVNGLTMTQFFAPRQEVIRRQVFEESKAYNDGMKQELYSMQREYVGASDEHKQALKSIILHRVDAYDVTKLPQDLQDFIINLRNEQ